MQEKFAYKYVAPTEAERKEIAFIQRQYQTEGKAESKLDRLRRLDRQVKTAARTLALLLGIAGCLLFGLGLAMVLEWKTFAWGGALSLLGAIPMAIAYPAYTRAVAYGKRKKGEEILRLAEELLKE